MDIHSANSYLHVLKDRVLNFWMLLWMLSSLFWYLSVKWNVLIQVIMTTLSYLTLLACYCCATCTDNRHEWPWLKTKFFYNWGSYISHYLSVISVNLEMLDLSYRFQTLGWFLLPVPSGGDLFRLIANWALFFWLWIYFRRFWLVS